MGTVFAEITLKNVFDQGKVLEGRLKEHEVRSVTVTSVVDTGAGTLVINEELRQKLGLRIREERNVQLANGGWVPAKLTDPVDVCWKNRHWVCTAAVFPGAELILLGAIPLEGMDLMICPKTQELTGVHGDEMLMMMY
ncbi:MAG: aspartyl protease family protein [Treponema sp.]|jgi:clan AA aspartic protease|nr:aspartyl protease family protein [Treponema sp.]